MMNLDNASTTCLNEAILETYLSLLKQSYSNPSSLHHRGREAHFLLEKARKQILSLFSTSHHQLIFTSGATEANNLALKGLAFAYQKRGKHLISSIGEHPSVLEPLFQLRDFFGFSLTLLPLNASGSISLDDLEKAITKETILISLMHVNNETGAIHPISDIAELLKKYPKIIFHSDITQSLGKIEVPFSSLDAFSFSAHKIHGLKGSGALCIKKNLQVLPLLSGGGQEFGFRSGTPNVCADVVLAKTVRLALENQKANETSIRYLSNYLREALCQIAEIQVNSPIEASPYILNISFLKHKAAIMVEGLSKADILVGSISACSSKHESYSRVVNAMFDDDIRASHTLRISLSAEINKNDLEHFVSTLKTLLKDIKPR